MHVHACTYTHVCQRTCNHVCCVYTKRRKKQKENKCSSSEKKETMKGKEGNRRDTGFKADERNFYNGDDYCDDGDNGGDVW